MYYYFADIESLRPSVREMLENIFLIFNEKWNYKERKETDKMLKMFEESEEILSEVMSIKEIAKGNLSFFNLTDEEKCLLMLENPEEQIANMKLKFRLTSSCLDDDLGNLIRVKVLAKFVLKMAVYRFCIVHYPKARKKTRKIDIELLKNEMEEWEKQFWTPYDYNEKICFRSNYNIAENRMALRGQYSNIERLQLYSGEMKDIWNNCIVRAFKDMDTVENVKKMRQDCTKEKQSGKEDINNKSYEGNVLVEIQHMKHLLDILERNIQGKLTEQDTVELKKNTESWNKDIEKLEKMINSLNMNVATSEENVVFEEEKTFPSDSISKEEYVCPDLTDYDNEEFREQISSFVENMTECINDFIDKVDAYESDEELYDELDIEAPYPPDYDSEVYDYSTKVEAKVACKEAVKSAIEYIFSEYERERDNIVSYTIDYFNGLEEMLHEFIGEFLASYDEYASLECEEQAQEYVLSNKSKFFGEEDIQKEMRQIDLEEKRKVLINEIFNVPIKEALDVKEYFSICTYDEEDDYYCFNMEEACEKMHSAVYDLLEDAQASFPNNVKEVYIDSITDFCEKLNSRLAKL